jgi:hypothetical protein
MSQSMTLPSRPQHHSTDDRAAIAAAGRATKQAASQGTEMVLLWRFRCGSAPHSGPPDSKRAVAEAVEEGHSHSPADRIRGRYASCDRGCGDSGHRGHNIHCELPRSNSHGDHCRASPGLAGPMRRHKPVSWPRRRLAGFSLFLFNISFCSALRWKCRPRRFRLNCIQTDCGCFGAS